MKTFKHRLNISIVLLLFLGCSDLDDQPIAMEETQTAYLEQIKQSDTWARLKSIGMDMSFIEKKLQTYNLEAIVKQSQSKEKLQSKSQVSTRVPDDPTPGLPLGDLSTTFYAIADPQFDNAQRNRVLVNNSWFKALTTKAKNENKSIFVLGDLTQNGRQDEFRDYHTAVHQDEGNSYYIPMYGNHDVDPETDTQGSAWDAATELVRWNFDVLDYAVKSPDQYNFYFGFTRNHTIMKRGYVASLVNDNNFRVYHSGGFDFAILGNAPNNSRDTGRLTIDGTSGTRDGSLNLLSIHLLMRDLAGITDPIIIFAHQGFRPFVHQLTEGYITLAGLIESFPIVAMISGHAHEQRFYDLNDPFLLPGFDSVIKGKSFPQLTLDSFGYQTGTGYESYYEFDLYKSSKQLHVKRYQVRVSNLSSESISGGDPIFHSHTPELLSINVFTLDY